MASHKICDVDGCGRPAAGGLCNAHRARKRRYGVPTGGGALRDEMQPTCAVAGCGASRTSLGLCTSHYDNLRRRGDAMLEPTKAANGALLSWLMAHRDYAGEDCLTWPFSDGYGTVRAGGRQTKAHRQMCVLAHGPPPTPKHHAAHNCGRGHDGCVNPQHLRWDTAVGNHADRAKHGTLPLGEACWNAVLTEDSVRWARSMAGVITYREMSKTIGAHHGTVRAAVVRSSWAWLD